MNVSINIHKYWKIILILSMIVLTVVFFVFNEKIGGYSICDENFEIIQSITNFEGLSHKVSVLLNKDEFDSIIIPENMSLYYFPEECPNYKEDIFIRTIENDLDKYYIPEKNYLIILNKQHTWTKPSDKIVMWKK